MPISTQLIREATLRYYRERDRYEKLTRMVEDRCVRELIEGSGLRVNITARTKRLDSLEGKLKRFKRRDEKIDWNEVEDVFNNLSDFSGVRIIYYDPLDRPAILEILRKSFRVNDVDEKDRQQADPTNFYAATHLSVSPKEDVLATDYENIRDLQAEIQVCSLMAHVWNEVDHDIGYKPSGSLSDEEIGLLCELGRLKLEGDEIIRKLMVKYQDRLAAEDLITDSAGLASMLQEHFGIGRLTFNGNPGALLPALQQLDITTGNELKRAMGTGRLGASRQSLNRLWKDAQGEIKRFNKYLTKNGKENLALSATNSADPGLMLLLRNSFRKILRELPAGRGQGRPAKIRSLASAYKDFASQSRR